MNSTPPEVLDHWIEYDAIEPIPAPWSQTAAIAAEVYHLARLIAAGQGITIEDRTPADWIPTRRNEPALPPPARLELELEAMDRIARNWAGLN